MPQSVRNTELHQDPSWRCVHVYECLEISLFALSSLYLLPLFPLSLPLLPLSLHSPLLPSSSSPPARLLRSNILEPPCSKSSPSLRVYYLCWTGPALWHACNVVQYTQPIPPNPSLQMWKRLHYDKTLYKVSGKEGLRWGRSCDPFVFTSPNTHTLTRTCRTH